MRQIIKIDTTLRFNNTFLQYFIYIENGYLQILGYGTSEQAQILLQPIIAGLDHEKKKKSMGFSGLKTEISSIDSPPAPTTKIQQSYKYNINPHAL